MKAVLYRGKALTPSRTASLVGDAAKKLVMTKEEVLAIAKAEPKGATVFAGSVKVKTGRKPIKAIKVHLARHEPRATESHTKKPHAAS